MVTDEMVERAAQAIDKVGVGYGLQLTGLVDGISTYTLIYVDGAKLSFNDIDAAYAHIAARKRMLIVRAAITAAEQSIRNAAFEEAAAIAKGFVYSDETKACTNGARAYGNDEACQKIAAAILAKVTA